MLQIQVFFKKKTNRKYHPLDISNTLQTLLLLIKQYSQHFFCLFLQALALINSLDNKNVSGSEKLFFPLLSLIPYNAKTTSEIIFSYVSERVHKLNLVSSYSKQNCLFIDSTPTHNVQFRCFSRRPQHCPYTSSHVCAVDIHKSDKVLMSSKFRCLTTSRIRS